MQDFTKSRLFCFSPPVMLATFLVELALAGYVLYRYRFDRISQLTVAILVLLAIFQVAEFNICEVAFGVDSLTWSRIGYVAITFLPPLGIHLIHEIAGRKNRPLVWLSYLLAIGFSWFFLATTNGLTSSICGGNYVIFEVHPEVNTYFAIYYYGLELLAAVLAWVYSRQHKSKKVRQALYGMIVGYLCLMIPTTTVNLINPETIRAIPSIMCGFAVLLAVVLVVYVMPRVGTERKRRP